MNFFTLQNKKVQVGYIIQIPIKWQSHPHGWHFTLFAQGIIRCLVFSSIVDYQSSQLVQGNAVLAKHSISSSVNISFCSYRDIILSCIQQSACTKSGRIICSKL